MDALKGHANLEMSLSNRGIRRSLYFKLVHAEVKKVLIDSYTCNLVCSIARREFRTCSLGLSWSHEILDYLKKGKLQNILVGLQFT